MHLPQISAHSWRRASARIAAIAVAASMAFPQVALSASSWAPTLLVNTESFQTIDEGDSTTDVEIRFGGTLNEKLIWNRSEGTFQFTDDLSVLGILSGSVLRVDGAADIHGALNASGSIRTDGDLTLNADGTAADTTLTFGTSETLKFLNTEQEFSFSDDVSVLGYLSGSSLTVDGNANVRGALSASGTIRTDGNLSGSTLTVDGALTLRGVTYNAPTSQGGSNTFLRNDGAGNLTWTTTSVGNGSGLIMSFHPEYPNAVYFASGSSYIGQLTMSGGTSALDNSYVWTTTKFTLQDYWLSVRFRIPDNFSSWDVVKPIELRYKTGNADASDNHVTVRMKDTAGANVTLTNGGALNSASWTTANITGPQAGGTWTPKGYGTLYIKVAASGSTLGRNAALGFVNLNIETTTP